MPIDEAQWVVFDRWRERWGDIIGLRILGNQMVVLNCYKDAIALLDKKSLNYSDRPALVVVGKEMGWDQGVSATPYGDYWREQRRYLAPMFGSRKAIEQFVPSIEEHARELLLSLLEHPDNLDRALRRSTAALVLQISHGYNIEDDDDPILRAVDQVGHDFADAMVPGKFLVDLLPSLQYVPEWVPGAKWKQLVKQYKRNVDHFHELSYKFVKDQMASGTAIPSFSSLNYEPDMSAEKEHIIKWTAAAIFSAGSDTTISSVSTFFLAMTCFPEIQKRAQQEIDTVIGTDRLPLIADHDRLPYVCAIISEVLRWQPVTPLGGIHKSMEDDIYKGYFLPKGTWILPNVWKFLHDPKIYADPLTFNPDRFMTTDGRHPEMDPRQFAFGFGRRICPGLQFADTNMFAQCAMTLAVFDIDKATNDGRVVEPKVAYTTGAVSYPLPWEFSLKPRNSKAEALIKGF
ncbi:hypothetical protein CERSUDRAFT_153900 [Gelatoporia subvermispora B]|uniref:Cytochrome P450 n=1 Tax=Ceriporiopsis subvermispora (strain B) TaxID=914234 RepID=M2RER6_CERS8|nr:hypothetical protein CERSUDRAFT_153900 [Gelatoporia subvermispora B]